jgi:small conductance mechanosensitive channel
LFFPLNNLPAPAALFTPLQNLCTSDFWWNIYKYGQLEKDGPSYLLLLVLARLLLIVLVLLAARVAVSLAQRGIAHGVGAAISRTEHGRRRLTTLQGLLISTISYTIYFVAIMMILVNLGVSLAWLLSAVSVLGLAIGFGAQRLVRDVITGLFILGEGQFDAGDWVSIGGVAGRVEDIGLRVTRVRDEQGRMYIIANGDITQIFNASRGLVKLPIELSLQRSAMLDTDLATIRQAAEETLRQFGITLQQESEQPVVMVVGMDAVKVTVRLILWIPIGQHGAVEDALRRQLLGAINNTETRLTLA